MQGGAFSHSIKSDRASSSGCSTKPFGHAVAPIRSASPRTTPHRTAPTRADKREHYDSTFCADSRRQEERTPQQYTHRRNILKAWALHRVICGRRIQAGSGLCHPGKRLRLALVAGLCPTLGTSSFFFFSLYYKLDPLTSLSSHASTQLLT